MYFDGSGYVEVLFETLKDDRVFEQHVKLISQNGILLSFQRGVRHVQLFWLLYDFVNLRCNVNVIFLHRLSLLRISTWLWRCMEAFWKSSITLRERCPTQPTQKWNSAMLSQNLWVKASIYSSYSWKKCQDCTFKFCSFECFLCFFCFQLDVIFQLSKNEMLVRLDRQKMYTLHSKELNFTGRYFLGGVPEDEMPERWPCRYFHWEVIFRSIGHRLCNELSVHVIAV